MQPMLAVVARADSFATLWPELADAAGATLAVAPSADELAPLGRACGILLVVAGAEETVADELAAIRAAGGSGVAVIGRADHRAAAAAARAGAGEYFALPEDLEAVRAWTAERAARARAAQRARTVAEAERRAYDFSRMIGRSPGMVAALERAARIIPRDTATVLLTGETGTGKELLAQAIHYNGPRAARPFVDVNCAALPATLLEAELFGYEKGAFTDARSAKPGLFEAADGGTLFLDEIGDLAPELQAKLLKALEDKRVRRLGGLRAVDLDVRIVAATHRDLAAAVRAGAFREDLFYRLNVVPIHLPPLRERGDDLIQLAEHFVAAAARAYDVDVMPLTDGLRDAIRRHDWPGNVRELRNAMERAVLLGGGALDEADLFASHPGAAPTSAIPFPATLDAIERAAAVAMVERFDGNKSAAAAALAISRSRLYRLLDGADA